MTRYETKTQRNWERKQQAFSYGVALTAALRTRRIPLCSNLRQFIDLIF